MTDFKICSKKCLASGPVTKILQNPYNPKQMISVYFNGSIHIWKLPGMNIERKVTLNLSKITSFIPFQNSKLRGFLLGVKNGELAMINENFQMISSMKLHNDSISEIIASNERIITAGYDGNLFFLDKETFSKNYELNFENPLFSAVQYQNQIYLASLTSYIVCMSTYKFKQTKRFNKFYVTNNRIYGSSEDRGLSCLNSNSNNYLPAEFIILYQRKILIFSEKSICVANQLSKLQYKVKKYPEFSTGESITTGFALDGNIYVGGNEGNIYWIKEIQASEL